MANRVNIIRDKFLFNILYLIFIIVNVLAHI